MLLRDVALAAALAVGSLVPVFSVPNGPLMWRAIGWSLLMCASVALRRVTPLGALAVIAVVAADAQTDLARRNNAPALAWYGARKALILARVAAGAPIDDAA